jgi:hypothetical protein
VYGLWERDLEHNVALGGDNVLLATLIDISRRAIHSQNSVLMGLVGALTQFDIRDTLPGLQNDFCTLWNEIIQEARNRESYITDIHLGLIGHLFIALHPGTDAAPSALAARRSLPMLFELSFYSLCDIASHRYSHRPNSTAHLHITNSCTVSIFTQPGDFPDASPYPPSHDGSTAPQQVEQANIIVRPPSPSNSTTPSKIRDSSQAPPATSLALPAHTSPRPTDASSPGTVTATLQDISPSATLTHPLEGNTQQDIVARCAEPGINEISSTRPTPTPTPMPVPAPAPIVLNMSLASCDAGAPSASNDPFLPASSTVGFSNPASTQPSRVSPLLSAESLPTGNATLPRLRARGLVNTGSMCFANAVLRVLVHSPPFWNLFRELGDLKGQRGAGDPETGGGATPLMDATVRFFEEFMFKEKEPPTQQRAVRGKPIEDEEDERENKSLDSFEPTYLYGAMKGKRQLKKLLVRSCAM